MSALGNLGIDKIFGKGIKQTGFLIPPNEIEQLLKYKHLLIAGPCKQEVSWPSIQLIPKEADFLVLCWLLLEFLLNALTGRGFSVSKKSRGGRGLSVSQKPGMLMPYQPPPFLGTWEILLEWELKKAY